MRAGLGLSLGAFSGTVLAAACVPKVPATIVVDEKRPPDHQQPQPSADPKPTSTRDRLGPDILRAELVGGNRLRIHFSEPVAPLDGLDPADFRISFLRAYINRSSAYSYAYYYDPGALNYGSPIVHSQVRATEAQLEFDFSPEITSEFCGELEYSYTANYGPPNGGTEAGLFLHYAAGSIPIHDTAGNPMANFGADWVALGRQQPPETQLQLNGAAAVQAGAGLVRIACGPPIPPGPR